jgi:hypothetical protein
VFPNEVLSSQNVGVMGATLCASVRRRRRAHDAPCDDGKEFGASIAYRSGRVIVLRWPPIKRGFLYSLAEAYRILEDWFRRFGRSDRRKLSPCDEITVDDHSVTVPNTARFGHGPGPSPGEDSE